MAAEAFAGTGYASASIRDLARRSGLSSGAIYGAFQNKADLLAAAVDANIARDLETLPDEVLSRPLPEIVAHQFAAFEHPQRVQLRRLLTEAATAAAADPELRATVSASLEARLALWTTAHEEWQAEYGVEDAVDMRALSLLIVGADLGIGILGALGVAVPEAATLAEVVRSLMEALQAH